MAAMKTAVILLLITYAHASKYKQCIIILLTYNFLYFTDSSVAHEELDSGSGSGSATNESELHFVYAVHYNVGLLKAIIIHALTLFLI